MMSQQRIERSGAADTSNAAPSTLPAKNAASVSTVSSQNGTDDKSAEMLLLLSSTADKTAPAMTNEPEGYTSPPVSSGQPKVMTHSPQSKDVASNIEELKRQQRREQYRATPPNHRHHEQESAPISFGGLRIASNLTPGQATALAMALEAQNRAARSVCGSKFPKQRHPQPMYTVNSVSAGPMTPWSGQQYPINPQVVSYKRPREETPPEMIQIEALKHQIKKLQTYKAAISTHKRHLGLFQSVSNFYYALGQEPSQQYLPDVRKYQQMYGCSPALQLLMDLQREEFDSIASMQLHWLWYRTQFRFFQFKMTSCKRLELGEHVVIKVTGELRLDIYCGPNQQNGVRPGYGVIVCPVLQQFEFETGQQTAIRITSEVDLVGGVAAASKGKNGRERVLRALHCLSEGFCLSNRR
ncbi:hypothetical protein PHYBOEH_010991 [Phytophthora boehmeriae]|uniref:Uncharacterized protein n=1 Tax=Phytophthora boehmeriae TaxID=109152 RepID=A0A8T1VMR9_9STRA|nr:hypothetical protein PHYBOEH_010991 [Phytophthora boehmeriae]